MAPAKNKKFSSAAQFAHDSPYRLLPFRFSELDSERYVLSNLAGEFLLIAKQELPRLVSKAIERGSSLYNSLKSKHFIYDDLSSACVDLLALKCRTRLEQLSNFTGLHMFVATLRCNHSCNYCQVSRQTEDKVTFDMSEETAAKALDHTFRSPSPAIKIEFQGGEPLLNFGIVRWIIDEARNRNKAAHRDLQFVICSNLYELPDEVLEFCAADDIYFSTSLDGPEHIHNGNRLHPSHDSYQSTVRNIQRLRDAIGPDHISALMTTSKASLSQGRDIVDEYLRQGFNSIFLRPMSPYGFALRTNWFGSYSISDWLKFYFDTLDYIIEINRNGTFFVEQYASIILNKMFTHQGTNFVDLQSPAGLGIAAIVYNYNGEVYPSDEARMLAEMGDKTFCMGNVRERSYEQIMLSEALLDPLENSVAETLPACYECAFVPYCGTDPVRNYALTRDFVGHSATSGFCAKNSAVMRHLITLLEDDPAARKVLLKWVRY